MEQQESDLDAALRILHGMRKLAELHNAEWDETPTWIGPVLLDELDRLRALEDRARDLLKECDTRFARFDGREWVEAAAVRASLS